LTTPDPPPLDGYTHGSVRGYQLRLEARVREQARRIKELEDEVVRLTNRWRDGK
jgi:hypothetical protein